MKVLLIYPLFPKTFWSYERILDLIDRKALLPPLGLVTVAAILPQEWDFKLVDRNVRSVTEAEWDWADLVICSAMIVQKPDLIAQVQEAKKTREACCRWRSIPHLFAGGNAGSGCRLLDFG